MKFLLLGKNGQLGWELQRSLAPLGELIALDRDSGGDLTDLAGLERTVATLSPDVIVNAAAYTAVDKAEAEPDLARAVNALAPAALARAAGRLGALMVHYSTDYVFDGSGRLPWREGDSPSPLNVYGQTKLEGERMVAEHCPRHLILRTSWVYGARGGNFARTMLRLAAEREQLEVVDDQIGAPTGADLLADVTAHALRSVRAQPALAGLYHVAAGGETSWHGYARFVLEQAQKAGLRLKASSDCVRAVSSSQFPTAAKRPHNSRLDTSRLQSTFALALPHWQPGVARMLTEILSS
jgi:dTDP-4-dehydrorhamnose reductase